MLKKIMIASVALVLVGCATEYDQSPNFLNGQLGVKGEAITPNAYAITARGNAFTDSATIHKYVLMKAAELTLQNGLDWFEVVDSSNDSREQSYAFGSITARRHSAFGSSFAGSVILPGQTIEVRAHKGQVPEENSYAFDTHSISQMDHVSGADTAHHDCHQVNGTIKCD
jgi:hypothetical protein